MPNWTEEQRAVINLRNRNILVSAGAGSGKTAVMVERIIKIITDKEKPVDIDKLVVVTFTEAAAAEMKERIAKAISKALLADPDNEHLQRQQTLIYNAHISTIDSFCLNIVKNYFHEIDLSPDFRIADNGELELLKQDVIKELMEEYYEKGDKSFIDFVESFATGKDDEVIEKLIFKFYGFSLSYPDSKKWINDCRRNYQVEDVASVADNIYIKNSVLYAKERVAELREVFELAESICETQDGPWAYMETLDKDRKILAAFKSADSYEDFYQAAMLTDSFARLSTKKQPDVDPDKKEQVKLLRTRVKDGLKKLGADYFENSIESLYSMFKLCGGLVDTLCDMTLRFYDLLQEAKAERKIVDFSDLEHFALRILCDDEGNQTETGKLLADSFYEIFIDEYQDSNEVQDTLLRSISKESSGVYNIFRVGDVKQSIYRFRMAKPELFMEKYKSYSDCAPKQKIDLHKNFRSRASVLRGVNYIFEQLMQPEVGGVSYDEAARLIPGASYTEKPNLDYTELLLVDYDKKDYEAKNIDKIRLEARAVASRIRHMVEDGHFYVKDEEDEVLERPVRYGDIAILLRSSKGWKDAFLAELETCGVPVLLSSSTGYFAAYEVQVVLALLETIDNPRRELPLTAVLRSPIVGLTNDQLVEIRLSSRDCRFYEAVLKAKDEEGLVSEEIREKLIELFSMLSELRRAAAYLTVNELIELSMTRTGYLDYITAMPGGHVRRQNIIMLMERAVAYESSSYKGLFNFLRYIKQLKKYEIDFPEPEVGDEGDKVRIMTIHKSKGLEFPVVFLCGTGKEFNHADERDTIVLHQDKGIGIDYIDSKRRLKVKTPFKKNVSKIIADENLGEELRVLYVAMTRAKEKLIISGAIEGLDKRLEKLSMEMPGDNVAFSYREITESKSYLEWILKALARNEAMEQVFCDRDLNTPNKNSGLYNSCQDFKVTCLGMEQVLKDSAAINMGDLLEEVAKHIEVDSEEEGFLAEIDKRLDFNYGFENEIRIKTKMSVSELKKRAYQALDEDEQEAAFFTEESVTPYVPSFAMEKDTESKGIENVGALKGNLYHKILECLDYKVDKLWDSFDNQLASMVAKEYIREADLKLLYKKAFKIFFESDLAKAMQAAAKADCLYREKPFVMGVNAREIDPDVDSDEIVIVQGIIDAYYEEADGIVLLDYKTDRVESSEELIKRYKTQLDLYEEAIKRFTGKKVKARYIYAFSLNETVEL